MSCARVIFIEVHCSTHNLLLCLFRALQKQPFRFVTGVSSGGVGQLFAQQGTLPEVVIRGQYGSNANLTSLMVLTDVEALYSKAGGLDISLYAAGMICIDLLNRTQTVIDYTNKRIGWKIPPKEHLEEVP